jgi:hypothetical protein
MLFLALEMTSRIFAKCENLGNILIQIDTEISHVCGYRGDPSQGGQGRRI